ncbi:hypothetical protein D781_3012 [Serratia sp. FGI94]|nr:hypothetical protein D781_3012 [Serratia sp. FGI94]
MVINIPKGVFSVLRDEANDKQLSVKSLITLILREHVKHYYSEQNSSHTFGEVINEICEDVPASQCD